MKDYYKILDLDEEASQEKIQERWREVSGIYHPDLFQDPQADESIRELNEAYQVLRDPIRRFEYDMERALKHSVLKQQILERQKRQVRLRKGILTAAAFIILVAAISLLLFSPAKEAPVRQEPAAGKKLEAGMQISQVPQPEKNRQETALPPVPLSQTGSPAGNKETVGEQTKEKPKEKPAAKEAKGPGKKQDDAGKITVAAKAPARAENEILRDLPKIPEIPPSPERTKDEKGAAPIVVAPEKPAPPEPVRPAVESVRPKPPEPLKAAPSGLATEPRPSPKPAEVTEKPILEPAVPKPEVQAKVEQAAPKETSGPAPRDPAPSPKLAKDEEVRQFFSTYIEQYNRKDVEGFLTHFSPRAVQNQKDDLGAIRRIYDNFFAQSQELRYRLMGEPQIDLFADRVEVSARYQLDQTLKKGGEKKLWGGDIRWVLIRERGTLRVLSLEYKPQK